MTRCRNAIAAFSFLLAASAPSLRAEAAVSGDWPTFGRDHAHTAYAADPLVNAEGASRLGVRWMTNLYSADLGSPVIAYSQTLRKSIVYVGDERGDLRALDLADGSTLWSVSLGPGAALRDTPLVVDGAVWVGTSYGTRVVKLDANTGQILCSLNGPASFFASPMAATIAGTTMVYASTIDEPAFSGPVYGINDAACSTQFDFTNFATQTGVWASPSYGVDALGRNVVILGSADPDSREYAIDAMTGKRYWVYGVYNPGSGTYDIGAAADISPPGTNGFADGVVYFPTKYGIMYALDLTTGKLIWQYNFNKAAHVTEGGLSTPARIRDEIVFGYNGGAFALNATTGATIWQWVDPTGSEVLSSPAIVGPKGREVVAFADLAGFFRVLRLRDGKLLYSYQTHGYVSASPAETHGNFVVSSSDGFVYDFATGGGNIGAPATTLTFPAKGASIKNDKGIVTLTGAASDAAGIKSVQVAVQSGGAYGPWYDAATNSWSSGAISNSATLAQSGTTSTAWHFALHVPASGGPFQVYANAVNYAGQADVTGATNAFNVGASKSAPTVTLAPAIAPPGGTTIATAHGFAPGENVTFSLAGTAMLTQAATAKGVVGPVTLTIPPKASFGVATVGAVGATSGDDGTTTVDVENAWPQWGYGPARDAFEPNDYAFHAIVHIGPGLFINQAWYGATGAPIETSPAIVSGLAYLGNDAGTLSAIGTENGLPAWSYTIPSGAAIRSSPAVDGGIVYFGADDGYLYRLSAATGAPYAPIALGGQFTAPVISGGVIYLSSLGGKLFAVDEASGATLWSVPGKAASEAAPAVDPAAGYVFTNDDGGHVTARSAASGAQVWRTFVGGALKNTPAISDGVVYAGSTNGTLFALNETTGAIVWSYAEGTPITTTPAIAPSDTFFGFVGNQIFVGSEDGFLTSLDSGTQKAVWRIRFDASIVGLAATLGDLVFYETASGTVGASRGPEFGDNFWKFQTGGTLDTSPVVVNGAAYVGAGDGGLYAFTPYGQLPTAARPAQPKSTSRAPAAGPLRASRSAWNPAADGLAPGASPIRVAQAPVAGSGAMRFHGGPVQTAPRTYAIFWQPPGATVSPAYAAAVERALGGRASPRLAGTAVDASAFPPRASDAAFVREIERVASGAHWALDANAQLVILPARDAVGSFPAFCAYHGALRTSGGGAVPYAVVPYPAGAGACGSAPSLGPSGDADADRVLPAILREQLDMSRDPLLNGWYDAAGREPGDLTGAIR